MKKILVFAGSIRSGSLSAKLAAHVARELSLMNAESTLLSLADYEMPIYNGDLENDKGVPENANKLRKMMLAHDGIYISNPEYNASMAPLLKNAIDWVSRSKQPPENPYKKCTFAIGATSDGRYGGYRGLYHLRQSLELGLGALVIPEQIAIAGASKAFDERGALKEESNQKILRAQLEKLVQLAGVLA